MSLERIIEILLQLGLTRTEAKVYVYLDNKGALNEREIMNGLGIAQHQLLKILSKLEAKGLVVSQIKTRKEFSAIAFEIILDRLIDLKLKQSKEISKTKKEVISSWRRSDWKNSS